VLDTLARPARRGDGSDHGADPPQRLSGLGGNPIPYIYVIIAASHCGFMLPSSAGSSAVADVCGINVRTM